MSLVEFLFELHSNVSTEAVMLPGNAVAIFSAVNQVHVTCDEVRRLGNEGDGGWYVCLSDVYDLEPGNCLVYSFGSDLLIPLSYQADHYKSFIVDVVF